MLFTKLTNWIQKIKEYIVLVLGEGSVRLLSVLRYSIDVIISHIRYKASTADYFESRFFEKTHKERKTYFTTEEAKRFIDLVDGKENVRKFHDKNYMYHVLGKLTKREQLFCPPESYAEFEDFLKRHGTVFYKRSDIYCGSGVERWSLDTSDIRELYERSLEYPAVLDEPVIQHPEIARLNPDTINTVKIYAIMIADVCHFIAAEFRIGRAGAVVDNCERGGLFAQVDLKTGTILGDEYDLRRNSYSIHPDTGVPIRNFVIPNWDEVLRFTEECARACPLPCMEWDIAIRESDCVLIEANPNVRNCEIQLGGSHGMKKQYQELEKLYLQSISQTL